MMNAGFGVIVLGYVLAAWGAVLLFRNTPWEFFTVDDPDADISEDETEATIQRRRTRAHRGFGLLMVGTLLQLLGVVIQWVASNE